VRVCFQQIVGAIFQFFQLRPSFFSRCQRRRFIVDEAI
jgi:hypothetical protein